VGDHQRIPAVVCFYLFFANFSYPAGLDFIVSTLPIRYIYILSEDRQISSWVGDHQRIPAVVCFYLFFANFSYPAMPPLSSHLPPPIFILLLHSFPNLTPELPQLSMAENEIS
jgi:hypothetical protein